MSRLLICPDCRSCDWVRLYHFRQTNQGTLYASEDAHKSDFQCAGCGLSFERAIESDEEVPEDA